MSGGTTQRVPRMVGGGGEAVPTHNHPPRNILMGGSAGGTWGSTDTRLMAGVLTVAPSDGGVCSWCT